MGAAAPSTGPACATHGVVRIAAQALAWIGWKPVAGCGSRPVDDLIDESVAHRVLAPQDVVAVDVGDDPLPGLAGGLHQDPDHPLPHLDHLGHGPLEVSGLALCATVRLVDQHPGVG